MPPSSAALLVGAEGGGLGAWAAATAAAAAPSGDAGGCAITGPPLVAASRGAMPSAVRMVWRLSRRLRGGGGSGGRRCDKGSWGAGFLACRLLPRLPGKGRASLVAADECANSLKPRVQCKAE